MRRREFLGLVGGAAAWPARAQQPRRMRQVGVLISSGDENDAVSRARVAAFQQGLERLGWIAGSNLAIDYRWPSGDVEKTKTAAAELVRLAPDAIVTGATPGALALQAATQTIPVVFVGVSEPIAQGLVRSLARPGGNVTGFTNLEPTLGGKWLELLKEIAPSITHVAAMFNPVSAPNAPLFVDSVAAAAEKFAIKATTSLVHDAAAIEAVMIELARAPGSGLIAPPDAFTTTHRKLIIDLAARYRLPAIYAFGFFATDGALVSYGVDIVDQFRKAAGYVDRILRGEKPADLPVQQPVKFELIINMKTAKALGLIVPLTLQVAADEVIE